MGEGYQRLQIESEESQSPKQPAYRKYYVGGAIAFSALIVLVATLSVTLTSHTALSSASHTHNLEVQPDNTRASKRGAGLLLTSGNEVLLLLRNSKHNNNTWGLPGGNVEDEDTNLLVTAKREAQEEMGSVPEAAFLNQILTKYASIVVQIAVCRDRRELDAASSGSIHHCANSKSCPLMGPCHLQLHALLLSTGCLGPYDRCALEAVSRGLLRCRRGKHGKKHYTVFIGTMTAAARQQYKPQLNHEHSQWRWFQLEDAVQQPNLHPVVELMFSSAHKQQVLDAMLGS